VAELDRTIRGHDDAKAERFYDDRAAMRWFPKSTFEAHRIVHAQSSSLSLARFDRNDYSVSVAFAHRDLIVVAGVDTLKIIVDGTLVANHAKRWGKERVFFDPLHYLTLLKRKPGAFDTSNPLEHWQLSGCSDLLRRRLPR
jgi:hypothetical protein